jgi:hypothetical protein
MDGVAARNKLIALKKAIPFVFVSGLDKDAVRILPNESPIGFVHKSEISHHLPRAMRTVMTGRDYASPRYRD